MKNLPHCCIVIQAVCFQCGQLFILTIVKNHNNLIHYRELYCNSCKLSEIQILIRATTCWLTQAQGHASLRNKSSLWIISLWFLTIVRMKKFPHWKHTAVFLQGTGHCESNSCDSWRLPFNRIICYKPVNKQKHNHMLTHTSTRPCEFRKQMFIVNHIVVILDDRQNEKFATLKTHGPLWIK